LGTVPKYIQASGYYVMVEVDEGAGEQEAKEIAEGIYSQIWQAIGPIRVRLWCSSQGTRHSFRIRPRGTAKQRLRWERTTECGLYVDEHRYQRIETGRFIDTTCGSCKKVLFEAYDRDRQYTHPEKLAEMYRVDQSMPRVLPPLARTDAALRFLGSFTINGGEEEATREFRFMFDAAVRSEMYRLYRYAFHDRGCYGSGDGGNLCTCGLVPISRYIDEGKIVDQETG